MPEFVTRSELARRLGVSKMTPTHWGKKGFLVETDQGIDYESTVKKLAGRPDVYRGGRTKASQIAMGDTAPEVSDDNIPETAESVRRKEHWLAKLRELEYDKEAGKVVDIETATRLLAQEEAVIRSHFLGLGAKVAPLLVLLKDPAEVKDKIDREVVGILEALTSDARRRLAGEDELWTKEPSEGDTTNAD